MGSRMQGVWSRWVVVGVMAVAGVAFGALRTVYVDSSAAGVGTGTAADPYSTIGAAVADLNGDAGVGQNEGTVLIAGGSYSSTLNGGKEDFGTGGITITKYMSIQGGYAAGGDWTEASRVPRTTDIDLTSAGTRAFYEAPLVSNQRRLTTFDGLTVRNADHTLAGGAIGSTSLYGAGMVVNDCLFQDNTTTADGGALHLRAQDASSILTNSDFVNNSSGDEGGAVKWDATYSATHKIEDCTFDGNSATYGGAVQVNAGSNSNAATNIIGSTFTDNSATTAGGAVYSYDGAGTPPVAIKETTFTGNSAPAGAAVGGSGYWHGEYYLENCLVAANTGGYAIQASGWRVTNDYALDLAYCTVVDNPGGGIYANQVAGNEAGDFGLRVRNSIVASNGSSGIYYNANGFEASILEYNDVWDQASNYLLDAFASTGSVSMDPKFRGSGANPYLLKLASPIEVLEGAIDLGLYSDLLGDARPSGAGFAMGAFEVPVPEPATVSMLLLGWLVAGRRRRRA